VSSESEKELVRFRELIDEIDLQILHLMNQRIGVAQSIAEVKKEGQQSAIYRAEREAQVLQRLKDLNAEKMQSESSTEHGMENADIESLFREIMSITRGSEAQLSVSLQEHLLKPLHCSISVVKLKRDFSQRWTRFLEQRKPVKLILLLCQ